MKFKLNSAFTLFFLKKNEQFFQMPTNQITTKRLNVPYPCLQLLSVFHILYVHSFQLSSLYLAYSLSTALLFRIPTKTFNVH